MVGGWVASQVGGDVVGLGVGAEGKTEFGSLFCLARWGRGGRGVGFVVVVRIVSGLGRALALEGWPKTELSVVGD